MGPWLGFGHGGVPFLNRDFGTSLGALVALALAGMFSTRASAAEDARASGRGIAVGAFVLGNIVLLVAMGREIHRMYLQAPGTSWAAAAEHADFTFSAWLLLQGIVNLAAGFARRVALARWAGLLLLGVTLLKVVAYDMRSLGTGYHVLSYLGLGVVLMAVSFAYQKDWLHLREAVATDDVAPSAPSLAEVPR